MPDERYRFPSEDPSRRLETLAPSPFRTETHRRPGEKRKGFVRR